MSAHNNNRDNNKEKDTSDQMSSTLFCGYIFLINHCQLLVRIPQSKNIFEFDVHAIDF
jgi:hypothetical protein